MADQPSDQPQSITEAPLVIEMRKIVKRFPGVLANDHVDFELREVKSTPCSGKTGPGRAP